MVRLFLMPNARRADLLRRGVKNRAWRRQVRKGNFNSEGWGLVGSLVTSVEKYAPLGAAVTTIDDRRVEMLLGGCVMEAAESAESLSGEAGTVGLLAE